MKTTVTLRAPQEDSPAPTRRILVIATDELAGARLVDEVRGRIGPRTDIAVEVKVVVPAVEQSALRRLFGEIDPSAGEAAYRLAGALGELGRAGIAARGAIGDTDPLLAAEEGLRGFDADEILLTEKARTRAPRRVRRHRARSQRRAGRLPRRSR